MLNSRDFQECRIILMFKKKEGKRFIIQYFHTLKLLEKSLLEKSLQKSPQKILYKSLSKKSQEKSLKRL